MADALKLAFADEATVNRISQLYHEPEWMRAERHDGLRLFSELPIETNPLFTLYRRSASREVRRDRAIHRDG